MKMSKQQKAVVLLAGAVVGQVMLSKVAKQQAATLGLPTVMLTLLLAAAGTALA
jgi:Ca2+/Na+ antiporter